MTNTAFTSEGQAFLCAFYKGQEIDPNDTENKIQALLKKVAADGMTVASADGVDGPEFELRALEYYFLIKNGFNE